MAKYLTHSNPEPLALQLDDHWFHLEPEEPYEVDSTFYFDKLMEIYGGVYGLVEIPVTKSRLGLSMDMDAAVANSKKELKRSYMRAIRRYVDDQLTDRIRKGLPALPPQGRAALAIVELKVNLKKRYGFAPIDWDMEESELHVPGAYPQLTAAPEIRVTQDNTRVDMLEAQLLKSQRIIELLAKQLGADLSELEDEALAAESQAAAAKPKRARKSQGETANDPANNQQPMEV